MVDKSTSRQGANGAKGADDAKGFPLLHARSCVERADGNDGADGLTAVASPFFLIK